MKKRTRLELETGEQMWTGRALALSCLVRSLNLPAGWRFVCSPRGYEAWLFFVADDGSVTHYSSNVDSETRRRRANDLMRLEEKAPGTHMSSLSDALDQEQRYLAHASGQGSVPFAQPFAVQQ
jgi:hypothetical protein